MRKLLLGAMTMLPGAVLPAQAADAPPFTPPSQSQVTGLETVVVTARKRSENAQAVPIAITALDQSELDKLSVRTVEDLKYVAPSVYVAPTTFRQDTLNITIRGQRDFDSSSGQSVMSFDPAAAVYMDGVYLARPVGLTASLFDIDSVQVLKGPQGTLVGRNSTGGAVLYSTRKPDSVYGGYAEISGGDHGRGEMQGAINIPLSDTVFFRAAAQVSDAKGYIVNYYTDPTTGYRNNQPAMGSDKIAGNFSLLWKPDDSFSLLLRANIAAEHDTGSSYHDLGYFPGSGSRFGKPAICNIPGTCTGFTDMLGHVIAPYYTGFTAAGVNGIVNSNPASYNSLLKSVAREQNDGFWSTEQTVSNADIGHYHTFSATLNKSFDAFSVKWLSAYRGWDNHGTSIGRGLPYNTAEYIYQTPGYRSVQSELTLDGDALEGALKWTGGLFYFQEDSPNDGGYFYLFIPSAVTPQPLSGKNIAEQDGTHNSQRNTSYAAYAQATYAIWPDTRLTAGIRYTYDERHAFLDTRFDYFPASPASTAAIPNGIFDPASITFHGITYSGQTHACVLTDRSGKLLPLSQCAQNINASFHKPTWTLALDHDLWAGTMVYATMRSGYRSGAINSAAVQPAALIAQPEELIDYEAGIKSDWTLFGMPVRTNLDAYFSDYHNIQVLVNLPNVTAATSTLGGPCTQAAYDLNDCPNVTHDDVTLNARAAHIQGAEWDITMLPINGLTLNAAGSYLDARYSDYTYTPPPGYLLPTGTTNLSGTPFPLPVWQTNETATYAIGTRSFLGLPVDDVTLTAHYYWQSRYLADLRTFDPSQRTSAYGFLNFRIDVLNLMDKNVDLAATMDNVLNTPACLPEYQGVLNSAPNASFGIANTAGVLQCVPLPPRMTGLSLRYKF